MIFQSPFQSLTFCNHISSSIYIKDSLGQGLQHGSNTLSMYIEESDPLGSYFSKNILPIFLRIFLQYFSMLSLAQKYFDSEILKCFQWSPEHVTFLFSLKDPAYPSYFMFTQSFFTSYFLPWKLGFLKQQACFSLIGMSMQCHRVKKPVL